MTDNGGNDNAASSEVTNEDTTDADISWTPVTTVQAIAVFILAGICEIGGGWLVWQAVMIRRKDSNDARWYYYAASGSALLVIYGIVPPTLQPPGLFFGRVYAVYGGVFIVLSLLAGWLLDGDRPDVGDGVGSAVALAGVSVMLWWPR